MLWSLTELVIPFLTQILIDDGVNFQDKELITTVILVIFAFHFLGMTANLTKNWLLKNVGVRVTFSMLDEYYRRIIRKKYLNFFYIEEGGVIQNTIDIIRIENFMTKSLSSLVNSLIKLGLFTAVLFYFDPTISFIFITAMVLLIGWDVLFIPPRKLIDIERFKALASIKGNLIQSVRGIFDIKLNNREKIFSAQWSNDQEHILNVRLGIYRIDLKYEYGEFILIKLKDNIVLLFACLGIADGHLTLGTFVAIQYIMAQSAAPVRELLVVLKDWVNAKLSIERINELYEEADTERGGKKVDFSKAALIIEDLHFTYPNANSSLNIPVFRLPFGEHIGIVGSSGSGKTTFLNLLTGLIEPQRGRVYLETGDRQIAAGNCRFGFLSQSSYVFPGSLHFNITLASPTETDKNKLEAIMLMVGLKGIVEGLPKGLDTEFGSGHFSLSKGQLQRVLIARAMYNATDYLILDEPTSALDQESSLEIIDSIRRFCHDKSLIVASHKMEIIQRLDTTYRIKSGNIHLM